VHFNVSIRLEDCPKISKQSHIFSLYPVGLSEAVQIQLETLCDCDCELPPQAEMNSARCSYAGSYECGVCNCHGDHFGRLCNCSSNSTAEELLTNNLSCKKDGIGEACSGRGDCVCGECQCHQRTNTQEVVDGQYCHCDNFTCPRDEKQRMCGGPERGFCSCKKCVCEKGWTDEDNACTCTTDDSACLDKKGGVCNGNGICSCGQCKCLETDRGRYEGQLCEDCPDCGGKCDDLRPCVECQIWQSGEYNEDACRNNCTVEIMTQTSLPEALCIFTDKDGCTFRFSYSLDASNKTTIYVLDTKDCPQPANVMAIIIGVAGGILIAGILLALIVRLFFFFKDRRDYARFLEQVKATTWGQEENPIYKAAISNYTNPTYGTAKPVQ
uniref:Integrin beta subunit tail domain-containing protein n=1 Tax=Strigamia maritima TaxID=126957 RepID=T1JH90_STRMM